jgi:predicted O-linked N-acetylglucosamine transferase (SPINDLY family)
VIKSPGLGDAYQVAALNTLLLEAGVDLGRTEFRGPTTKNDHLKAYSLVDVGLDTSPHGGGMSTLEAAWMGVPILTLPHQQIVSRIATTINRELGLEYLIASDWDDYVARAVALNDHREDLMKTRRLMRDVMRVSNFADHGSYTRQYELTLRALWQRWCRGEGPKKSGLRVVA